MINYENMNNELGEYFRSLPDELKKNILNSGIVFRTKPDMLRALQHFSHENKFQ